MDEILNLSNLKLENISNEIILFKQNFYYYKFNLKLEICRLGTKVKYKMFKSPQWLRNIKIKISFLRIDILFSDKKYSNIKFIENGGWHFSNMKSPAEIEKMRTYLHHREYDINPLGEKKLSKLLKVKNLYII